MGSIRYNTLAVFVGPEKTSGDYLTGDINQLHRIQSSDYSIEIPRESVGTLGTSNTVESVLGGPIVNFNYGYLVSDGQNEKKLGFNLDGRYGALSTLYSGERDYFLLVEVPNQDKMVLAIGNGVLTKYSVSASVNDFLRANVEIRGLNIKLDQGTSGNDIPRVNIYGDSYLPYTYALPPVTNGVEERQEGQIESNLYVPGRNISANFLNNSALGLIFSGQGASYLQSFTMEVNLPRNEIIEIGAKYPLQRCLQLPAEITLNADFIVSKYVADNIQNYLCQDSYDLEIDVKQNKCETLDIFWEENPSVSKLKYTLKGLKLRNQSIAASINDKKRVSLQWYVRVGNLLDLSKNLFISGDYGRYDFAVDSFRTVSGNTENTGYGLAAFEQEITYKRVKVDSQFPDLTFDMTGTFDIYPDDVFKPVLYYTGTSGIQAISGDFGNELSVSLYKWNADSYSTVDLDLANSGYSYKFSNLNAAYNFGYPDFIDTKTGVNYFYVKSRDFNDDKIHFSLSNVPEFLDTSFEYDSLTLDPEKPFFFNKLNLTIRDLWIPTGQSYEFDIQIRTESFKRAYKGQFTTPYSYHIQLPSYYSGKTNFWFEPYDTRRFTTSGYDVLTFKESSIKQRTFFASGSAPIYGLETLNGKNYVSFDGASFLNYTGAFFEDFQNFSIFAVYKPESGCSSGASLFRYSTSGRNFTFGRSGQSQNAFLAWNGPTKTGYASFGSGFKYAEWNMASLTFDGSTLRSNINGTQSLQLFSGHSGSFANLYLASGYQGSLAEIIVSPYNFNSEEVVQVENYLRYKWGLT